MPHLVALYRALNVGGRRITMDRLRSLHADVGLEGVRTHLASGNVLFRTDERDRAELAQRLESAFEREIGFASEVILRDAAELRACVARNPFLDSGYPPKLVHTLFLASPPSPEAVQAFRDGHEGPELVDVGGAEAYVYFPDGSARSKIDLRPLGTGTARNANTVAKLLSLLEEME